METPPCVDCACTSPETDSSHAFISAQHGWRLTRERSASGGAVMAWRCPDCWRRRKERRAVSAAPQAVSDPRLRADLKSSEAPAGIFALATRHLRGQLSEPSEH